MLRLLKPNNQIYLVTAQSYQEVGKSMVRISEFFENPNRLFRRKFFTMNKFEEWYKRTQTDNNRFTYYSDYQGWNCPGNIVELFLSVYGSRLRPEEIKLFSLLGWGHKSWPESWYLIGCSQSDLGTLDHEIAHALWTIVPGYRESMLALLSGPNDLSEIKQFLRDAMYSEEVFIDEISSYVMFDSRMLNRNKVKTGHFHSLRESMLAIYREYYKKHIRPRKDWS